MEFISQLPSIQRLKFFQHPTVTKNENPLVSQKNLKWSPTTKTAVTSAIATSILGGGYFAYQYLTKAAPPPVTISPYASFEFIKATIPLLAISLIGLKVCNISKFNRPQDSNPQQQSKATNQEVEDKYNEAMLILEAFKNPSGENCMICALSEKLTDITIFLISNKEFKKLDEIYNKCPEDLLDLLDSYFIRFLHIKSREFLKNKIIIKNSRNDIILFLDTINNFIIQKNTKHFKGTVNFFKANYDFLEIGQDNPLNFETKTVLLKILNEFKDDTEIEDKIFGLIYSFMDEAAKNLPNNHSIREDIMFQEVIEEVLNPFMNENPKFLVNFIQTYPTTAGKLARYYDYNGQWDNEPQQTFDYKIRQEAEAYTFKQPLNITDVDSIYQAIFVLNYIQDDFELTPNNYDSNRNLVNLYSELCKKDLIEDTIKTLTHKDTLTCMVSLKIAKRALLSFHDREDLMLELEKKEKQLFPVVDIHSQSDDNDSFYLNESFESLDMGTESGSEDHGNQLESF